MALRFLLIALASRVLSGVQKPFRTANVEGTAGTHEKAVGRFTDAALTTRYLLVKRGGDDDHIAVCAAANVPLGTVADEADAAEKRVHVNLLGKGPTKKMVALAAIGAGVKVYTAAGGKVQVAPTGATVHQVGVSVTAAASADDVLEVNDCVPVSVTFA